MEYEDFIDKPIANVIKLVINVLNFYSSLRHKISDQKVASQILTL